MVTETEKRRMSQAMANACGRVGGQVVLARAIGRPEETVSNWANGKYLVDPSWWSRSSASSCRATNCGVT
jgi:DNA-binding transcriptional regulator YdaS (Cro superfamily)